ncbi:MAG: hypothetical protein CVU59_13685 [Deltaproteobacteria bacterium HGW-Deltaproteobacteria-17]|nr:MAG: hypothetical protein CVU59_13685 [Deltaproteobacteria bacterium HGW-Deltaproteobacteria-17]
MPDVRLVVAPAFRFAAERARAAVTAVVHFLSIVLPLRSSPAILTLLPFSMVGIAVLTNVNSGKNRHGKYRGLALEDVVGPDGLVIATQCVEELDDAIQTFLDRGERVVCLNGGDGTIQRVVSHVIKNDGGTENGMPLLLPLRGGTMNVIADNLKLSGKPHDICAKAVAAVDGNGSALPIVSLPTIRVEKQMASGTEVEYGFLFGNGALYRTHRLYYEETDGGNIAAVKIILKCLAAGLTHKTRYAPVFGGQTAMKVTIDGKQMEGDTFTICLAMMFKSLVLSFSPFREGEGDFYVLATSARVGQLAPKLHKLFWAKEGKPAPLPEEIFFNSKARELIIETSEGHTFDGEVYAIEEPHALRLTRGPDVRFLKL